MWRSILKGAEVVKERMIGRVGSRENIRIWSDPWISSDETRPLSTVQESHTITHVS
jgi:hypothetical protein